MTITNIYEIPLNAENQRFHIDLNGTDYTFTLRWNSRGAVWILNIGDTNERPLINGIPLLLGVNLLAGYKSLAIGGIGTNLFIRSATTPQPGALPQNPSFADLGGNARLYFGINQPIPTPVVSVFSSPTLPPPPPQALVCLPSVLISSTTVIRGELIPQEFTSDTILLACWFYLPDWQGSQYNNQSIDIWDDFWQNWITLYFSENKIALRAYFAGKAPDYNTIISDSVGTQYPPSPYGIVFPDHYIDIYGWNSLAISIQFSTQTFQYMINGVLLDPGVTWSSNEPVSIEEEAQYSIYNSYWGPGVALSDYYFSIGRGFFDLTDPANATRLFSPDNKPIYWGEHGELVTEHPPVVYLHGDAAIYLDNFGTGGPWVLDDAYGPNPIVDFTAIVGPGCAVIQPPHVFEACMETVFFTNPPPVLVPLHRAIYTTYLTSFRLDTPPAPSPRGIYSVWYRQITKYDPTTSAIVPYSWYLHDFTVAEVLTYNFQTSSPNANLGIAGVVGGLLNFLIDPAIGTAGITQILSNFATESINQDTGVWHHIIASWDLTGGSPYNNVHLYVDGISHRNLIADIIGSPAATTINYASPLYVWGKHPPLGPRDGGMLAELYFAPGQYLDLSNSTNRAKFYNAGHAPELGETGSTPTGISPSVFLSGPLEDFPGYTPWVGDFFLQNRGTGGNVTILGADPAAGTGGVQYSVDGDSIYIRYNTVPAVYVFGPGGFPYPKDPFRDD